jgi:hypothetical protein
MELSFSPGKSGAIRPLCWKSFGGDASAEGITPFPIHFKTPPAPLPIPLPTPREACGLPKLDAAGDGADATESGAADALYFWSSRKTGESRLPESSTGAKLRLPKWLSNEPCRSAGLFDEGINVPVG